MTDTSEQAAKDRAQAQLTKAMADMVTQVSFAVCLLLTQDWLQSSARCWMRWCCMLSHCRAACVTVLTQDTLLIACI